MKQLELDFAKRFEQNSKHVVQEQICNESEGPRESISILEEEQDQTELSGAAASILEVEIDLTKLSKQNYLMWPQPVAM